MNRVSLINLSVHLAIFTALSLLSHVVFSGRRGSKVLNAVSVGSYLILLVGVLQALRKALAHTSLCKAKQAPPRAKHERLSVQNIIIHVYLMGMFIFVAVYCLLGESRDATKTFFISLAIISMEDVFTRTADKGLRRGLLFFSSLMAAVSVALIQGHSETAEAVLQQRWFVLCFGWLFPCLVPVLFIAIRRKRFYSMVTVFDFVNFGMPFAIIIAFLSIISIDLVRHTYDAGYSGNQDAVNASYADGGLNASYAGGRRNVTISLFNHTLTSVSEVDLSNAAVPLLAVLMVPTISLLIETCLLYCTVDTVSSAAVVWAFRTLVENNGLPNAFTVVSYVSASVGFCFRVYACFCDEDDKCTVAYTREFEEDEEEEQMLKSLQKDLNALDL